MLSSLLTKSKNWKVLSSEVFPGLILFIRLLNSATGCVQISVMSAQFTLNTRLSSWAFLLTYISNVQGVLFFEKMTDDVLDTIREHLVVSERLLKLGDKHLAGVIPRNQVFCCLSL